LLMVLLYGFSTFLRIVCVFFFFRQKTAYEIVM